MEALSKIYANRTEFYQTLIIGQFYPPLIPDEGFADTLSERTVQSVRKRRNQVKNSPSVRSVTDCFWAISSPSGVVRAPRG